MIKKAFRYYALVWLILLAVFNIIVFLVQPVLPEYVRVYDLRFWFVWASVIVAFIGHLVCAYITFKTDSTTKLFYNIPIIRVSYIGLVIMTISASVCMLIPDFPAWIAIIICAIILAFTVIAVIKATAASDVVSNVDTKVKEKTLFIKSLTVDAENLVSRAKTPEAKEACKKVFEAVRYSDPMSNNALSGVESQITLKLNEFSVAVNDGAENVVAIADEVIVLIGDRNRKCKLLK